MCPKQTAPDSFFHFITNGAKYSQTQSSLNLGDHLSLLDTNQCHVC